MAEKVGKKTGEKTKAGRDVYKTPEGESVSEKSVTIKFGENAYVNAPSIHDGVKYSEDEIKQMLLNGEIKPTSRHDTLEEALEAAKSRSKSLMNKGGVPRPRPRPKSEEEQMSNMFGGLKPKYDTTGMSSEEIIEQIKKERAEDAIRNEDVKELALDTFAPTAIPRGVQRTIEDIDRGDYISAGIEGVATAATILPIAGPVVSKIIRAGKKSAGSLKSEIAEAVKIIDDPDTLDTWKKQNKVSQEQKRVPEVREAAEKLSEGKITSKEYRHIVKKEQPIKPITSDNFPELPTKKDIAGALLSTDARKVETGIVGLNKTIPDGTRVGSRLDIPSYEKYDTWIVSLHDGTKQGGKAIGYGQTAVLKDVEFMSSAKGGLGIAKGKSKSTIARIHGDYYNEDPELVYEAAKKLIDDPEWTQVGMNPFRHSYFYDKSTGMPVTKADEVVQVGPLVLAKGVKKPTKDELKKLKVKTPEGGFRLFNQGGSVQLDASYEKGERGSSIANTELENLSASGQYTFSGDRGSLTPRINYGSQNFKTLYNDGFVVDEKGNQIGFALDGELILNNKGSARLRAGIEKQKSKQKATGKQDDVLAFEQKLDEDTTRFRLGGSYENIDLDTEFTDKGDVSGMAVYRLGRSGDISLQGSLDREGNIQGGANLRLNFNKGGTMKQQMNNAFQEGGLMDQGGTVDPVSGNDVPIGSTQEEVRDDIPAQLSEGEYVVPADVVRFYGIKFFEELRMDAKEGYQLLESKGQMGNGDEQVVPDDVPFGVEDIEVDDMDDMGQMPSSPATAPPMEGDRYSQIVNMIKQTHGNSIDIEGKMYTAEEAAKLIMENTQGQ